MSKPRSTFETELCALINRLSVENRSDTPDFILAAFMQESLDCYNRAVRWRDKWYGHETLTGGVVSPELQESLGTPLEITSQEKFDTAQIERIATKLQCHPALVEHSVDMLILQARGLTVVDQITESKIV